MDRSVSAAAGGVPPAARSSMGVTAMATGPFPGPQDPKTEASPLAPVWAQARAARGRRSAGGDADTASSREAAAAGMVRRLAVAELAEGLAHDLKNQLTVVAASVQLARDLGGGGREELLERAWQSAMRAARLMDEMLRYTQGVLSPEGDADAYEALETAVAGAWGYCGSRRVQLEMRPQPSLPRVHGAGPALRILLLYLLRWVADRCPPESRLVAEASVADGGVVMRMHALAADGGLVAVAPSAGAEEPPGGGEHSVRVLQALATEAQVSLDLSAATPVVRLEPAHAAAALADGGGPAHRAEEPGSGW
jgi:hypothetical protein